MPIFFAFVGLRTQLGLLIHRDVAFNSLLVIAVACLGKFGGSALTARAFGNSWRESSAIGVLMNTRGLMELVILNVGRDLGVINDRVFAMMVVMALATTAMTTPLLDWIYPRRMEPAAARGIGKSFSVLIPVALPKSGGPLVQLAEGIIGPAGQGEGTVPGKLVALHLRRPADHPTYRGGLDEAAQPYDESLGPLLAQARGRRLPVEPLSYISRDVPADINNVARSQHVDLVLMGFHKPIIGRTILGGTVHRVLTGCETDVAIFVDRGFRQARKILVPYLGSDHDRLAVTLAARMARNTDAQVTVLHVVAPMRDLSDDAARSPDARRGSRARVQRAAPSDAVHVPRGGRPVAGRRRASPSAAIRSDRHRRFGGMGT